MIQFHYKSPGKGASFPGYPSGDICTPGTTKVLLISNYLPKCFGVDRQLSDWSTRTTDRQVRTVATRAGLDLSQRGIAARLHRSIQRAVTKFSRIQKEVLLTASEFLELSDEQYDDYKSSAENGTFFVEWSSEHHSSLADSLRRLRDRLNTIGVSYNHPALVVVPWERENKPNSKQRGDLYASGGWPLFVKSETSDKEDELTSIYRKLCRMRDKGGRDIAFDAFDESTLGEEGP